MGFFAFRRRPKYRTPVLNKNVTSSDLYSKPYFFKMRYQTTVFTGILYFIDPQLYLETMKEKYNAFFLINRMMENIIGKVLH